MVVPKISFDPFKITFVDGNLAAECLDGDRVADMLQQDFLALMIFFRSASLQGGEKPFRRFFAEHTIHAV